MTDDRGHPCAAEGCPALVGTHYLMCRTHWYMVPVDTRRRIRTAVDRWIKARKLPRLVAVESIRAWRHEYRHAVADEVVAVREKEHRRLVYGGRSKNR